MQARIGGDALVALDAMRLVAPSCVLLLGWVGWPQAAARPTLSLAADGIPLTTLAFSRHERPDLRDSLGTAIRGEGFMMAARLPQPVCGGLPRLILGAGDGAAEVALPHDPVGPPLPDLLAQSHWPIVFELLRQAALLEDLSGLAADAAGGLGAFARWVEAVPLLPPLAEQVHGFGRIEATAAPSGECAIALSLPGPVEPSDTLAALAILDGPAGRRVVALEGPAPLMGEAGAVLYGRPAGAPPLPAVPVELIVQFRRPGGDAWFRTRPVERPAPDFLRALHAAAVRAAGADVMDSFAWLRQVLEDRLDALAPPVTAPEAAPGAPAPRVAVLHGIDDPFALRLVFLAAAAIEQRAAEVLVLGPRGAAAADIFLERGRVPARSSLDLAAAVRRGTYRRCALVPIDAQDLAAAVLDDHGFDALFAHPLPGPRLPLLLHLAAVAGRIEGGDTIERVTRAMRPGAGAMPGFGRIEGAAGRLLGDHLAEFWRRAAPAFAAGGADA